MLYRSQLLVGQRKQSGVALVIVLIFMLALTTIAIFASRNATMGERQARNETEYQIARQAAEAALRDAERDIFPDAALPPPATPACPRTGSQLRGSNRVVSPAEFTDSCLGGQCWVPAARYTVAWADATTLNPGEPWWPISRGGMWATDGSACADYTGPVPLGRYTGVAAFDGVAKQPDYLIEYIGEPNQDAALAGKGFKCDTPLIGVEAALASKDQTAAAAVPVPQMDCHLFRITARGFGLSTNGLLNPTPNTEVVMQSYFSIVKP